MKSITYIAEITNQKNEKLLSEGGNPLACFPLHLLASRHLRIFWREFTEKSFAIFDQSSWAIYLTWYRPLLFFQDFSSIRRGGTFLSLESSVNVWQKYCFFQLKAECLVFYFLDLSKTILNLMLVKINKNPQNFHCFVKLLLFYPLYNFRISVQTYQSIIQFDWARLTQRAVAKILSRRCQNSQKSENTQTSELNYKFSSKICQKHDTSLQLLGIRYSSDFYSTLLSFPVLKIFGFN